MPKISFHAFVLAEVKVRAYGFKTDLIWDALKTLAKYGFMVTLSLM